MDAHRVPIVVAHVKRPSKAQDLGIQVGWVIAKIEGEDLTQLEYSDAWGLMKEKVRVLPHALPAQPASEGKREGPVGWWQGAAGCVLQAACCRRRAPHRLRRRARCAADDEDF